MAPNNPVETTLTRRLRSLVRTGPLHALESGKAMRGIDLSAQDLRALCLLAIDATIERMGLGYGATRSDLVGALAPMIRASDPSADVAVVTDIVIEHLLNDRERRLQFEERYVDFDGAAATTRAVRFHLLKEEEADDGSFVLKATTEAINLYAGMLDVDVEDAQTAAEAVLHAQIERGAIGAAVATARQARLRSIEYAERLQSTIRQVRRDVTCVDTAGLLRTVQAARTHLDERLKVEHGLMEAVTERVSAAEADEAQALVELRDALDDCRRRHLGLHQELIGVHQTWLDEQERQRFRRARASALPDLERDVFQRLIAATVAQFDGIVDAMVLPLHAPASPGVFDLGGLLDQLLAPRRREAEPELETNDVDLEPIAALEARFDPATVARVAGLFERGGTLSELLARSRQAGDDAAVRRLLVLRALWAWDPDLGELIIARPAGALVDPEYQGHDLVLGGA